MIRVRVMIYGTLRVRPGQAKPIDYTRTEENNHSKF